MSTYIVKTNKGTFYVEAWNEGKVIDLMSYEGYKVISIILQG
jgi:hypothetical protein